MSAWDPDARRSDVVILTAIRLEFDAVLKVEAGPVPGSAWELATGPSGLPLAFRPFVAEHGRPLRVAVAVAPDMGATATTNTLLPLVEALKPRCIAMCGVCAGRPGKTNLGDVVAADRLYYHDTGKQLSNEIQQDLTTYKLRDDWKAALEGLDVVAHFCDAEWLQARPLTTEARELRALVALREGVSEPWKVIDPTLGAPTWGQIIDSLRERKWLAASGRDLTDEGRRVVDDLLFKNMGALPDVSPTGAAHRFRMHVAPMGSGTRVIEDEAIWAFISQAMRKTLGLEMEAAALGELAHRQRQYKLDAVVMKGVMDFAQYGRDDHFKEFAARASAECLLWFLREHVTTEVTPGFDDLLTSGTLPLSSSSWSPSGDRSPSFLLNAKHAVVPWHEAGRSEILADLDAWADNASQSVAVRLLHGEGGIGKTRLAIEWVRRRRERHDVAGFLVRNPDSRWLERLCGLGSPVLVVIEYAESRADLVAVLERVATFAAATGSRRRVRVLLLARGDGDWWASLVRQSSDIGALLASDASIKLSPLAATVADREVVFVEAAKVFAQMRGRPAVLHPPIALDDERFGRVLYLHMAALAAVEGVAFDAGSLMDAILDHEEHFWVSQGTVRHSVDVDVALARQLVAAATLRGGLTTEDEARELCMRFAQRGRIRDDEVLITLLYYVYERGDGARYLPGLEPDMLGEAMVLRVTSPPKGSGVAAGNTWIEHVLVAEDDEQALTTAFTVLGRVSAIDLTATRPWIENLLQSEISVRAVLALRAAKAIGQRTAISALGDLLAEALERNGATAIALDLEQEGIPRPSVSLKRVAVWQSRTLLESAPAGYDIPTIAALAQRRIQHGINLAELGQFNEALAVTREAVDLRRVLARRNPDVFQSELASSLNNLGNRLRDLGQYEAALTATREAVDLLRELAGRKPDQFQHTLASSLNNLGTTLSDLARYEQALAATREAVELYRTLATLNPTAFQRGLAGSLNNLGSNLGSLGQHESTLAATREGVNLLRILATRNPDAFQPDLASSLNNLGHRLHVLGQRERALAAMREAVNLFRALVVRNPEAFQYHLASSLNNIGVLSSELAQYKTALATTREAVEIRRTLMTRHPDASRPDLAMSLINLGNRLSELSQHEPALVATREAVDLYRMLAMRNSDLYRPHLALSLNDLGNRFSELGQHEAAFAATRDPFVHLAMIGGALDPADCARAARALISERLPDHPFDAAVRVKRILAARGFRDDATAFTLPDMLERRAGNCLGLTLLVGAVLLDRGHKVDFVVRLDPLDDVHDAGLEYFARLHDPIRGVDADSRLPEARDRAARYRFVPVEHASIVLPGAGGDRPFEATNLVDLEVPPGWAPAAESIRRVGFAQLASTVWCERAKALIRANPGDAATWRQALRWVLRGLRGDPGNREAWTEVWQAARALGRPALAAAAMARHASAGGDDSLLWFTRYRMTGDEACLDRALARLPAYAEAYLEKHVVLPLSRRAPEDTLDDVIDELGRRFAISAWLFATSEVLELEALYRRHAALVTRLFSAEELAALLASFGERGGLDLRE